MNYSPLPDDFPRPLASLLKFSDYTRGESEYSVTDLLKPVQAVQLLRRHQGEIVRDPRENIYQVLGSAVHDLLEKIGVSNPDEFELIEERLFTTIDDVTISGQIDLHTTYEDGMLTDWKHTKTSVLVYETKEDWIIQLNCYAHLLRKRGLSVSRARICAIFRDWSQSGINGMWKVSTTDGNKITCKRTKKYPEWGCEIIEIPLWEDSKVEEYLIERTRSNKAAESLPDDKLPECTPDERWRRDSWRVRKIGAIKAKGNKVLKTEAEAIAHQEKMGPEFEVSVRAGIPYRCLFYCDAGRNGFCHQLKREGFEVEWIEDAEDEVEDENM